MWLVAIGSASLRWARVDERRAQFIGECIIAKKPSIAVVRFRLTLVFAIRTLHFELGGATSLIDLVFDAMAHLLFGH